MKFRPLATAAAAAIALSAPALADTDPTVAARQGQFKLFAHNFGVVGMMVQGRIDYDAAAAQTAADNLYHLTRTNQGRLWPEGTDSDTIDGTRALPAIWADLDTFVERYVGLQTAVAAMREVAGDGLDALRPAVGGVGQACGACHDDFRMEQ